MVLPDGNVDTQTDFPTPLAPARGVLFAVNMKLTLTTGTVPIYVPSRTAPVLTETAMRAERDIKAANLSHHDLREKLKSLQSPVPQTEAEQLFSLDQPSLRALSHILRHKELWPKGFEWNFSKCSTCAMGLANKLWNLRDEAHTSTISQHLKIHHHDATYLFTYDGYRQETKGRNLVEITTSPDGGVTPEMVADKIDEYLAGVK